MTAPLLVIAAGGTGGHMFPAQALAEKMLARGWRVQLSTDDRGARYAGAFPDAVERKIVTSATFARGGLAAKLRTPFAIVRGVTQARAQMKADRPACVAGFGGYPTIPAMGAAVLLGLPRVLHEQNGVMGKVNRLFAPRVDRVACSVWPTATPAGTQAEHIGNPVRDTILAKAGAPFVIGEALQLLVIGGSQGAQILSDVVPEAIAALPDTLRARLTITQQARPEDQDAVTERYASLGIKADIRPFFDDIPERLTRAHLVISRSGASSVADISTIGRPSILIPYAHALGDHQTANAKPLVSANAAEMIQQSALTPASLSAHIALILGDPARATAMAQAALTVAKPDAADRLADLVETLSHRSRS